MPAREHTEFEGGEEEMKEKFVRIISDENSFHLPQVAHTRARGHAAC
jgi:hypothetical protein